MVTFYMVLTLSSVAAPHALFFSQPQPWKNELECRHALPKMESAVTRLMQYDPSALGLFGTIAGGPLNRSYFVSYYECRLMQGGP